MSLIPRMHRCLCLLSQRICLSSRSRLVLCWLLSQSCYVSGAKVCLVTLCAEDFESPFSYSGSRLGMRSSHSYAFAHDNEPLLSIWMASPITHSCGRGKRTRAPSVMSAVLRWPADPVNIHKQGGCVCKWMQKRGWVHIHIYTSRTAWPIFKHPLLKSNYSVGISYQIKVRVTSTVAPSASCCFASWSHFNKCFLLVPPLT